MLKHTRHLQIPWYYDIDITQYPTNLPQIPSLTPLQTAILTTELAAECTQAIEEFTPDPEDIVGAAAKIVDEFRRKCGIEPIKVLVIGPPGSGYVPLATKISQDLNIPLIDPEELCKLAQTDNSQWGQDIVNEIQESLEGDDNENAENENEPKKKIIPMEKISNEIVSKIVHHRMDLPDCHNRGWVFAGFADSYEKASTVFDEGEEEQPSPYFEHIPNKVIVLDSDDETLQKKAAELGGGQKERDAFQKKLKAYRSQGEPPENEENQDENEGKDVLSFFDDRSINSLVIDAFAKRGLMNSILKEFLGEKRDFGRPPDEIEAERLEKENQIKEKKEKADAEKHEKLNEQEKAWAEGDGIHQAAVKRLDSADEAYLADKAKDLEEYLGKTVLNYIVEGLIEVGTQMPEDPIDSLAAFFFAQNRKLKQNN